MQVDAAIVGIGCSAFGRGLPDSQLRLAAQAFKEALADAGLEREDVDGLSIHLGWPLGIDYDRVAEAFGLDIRYVNQSWLHGRFVTNALQHAALAVSAGLADVVACVNAVNTEVHPRSSVRCFCDFGCGFVAECASSFEAEQLVSTTPSDRNVNYSQSDKIHHQGIVSC